MKQTALKTTVALFGGLLMASGVGTGFDTASAKKFVAGSASSGGSNYLIMSGWAEIVNKNTDHQIIVEATGGPRSNIELMANGSAQIGVVAMSVAGPAFDGKGWANGKPHDFMRSLFGVHEAYLDGIALEKSGIKTFYDLEGQRVSVGPAGGTPSMAVPPILKALGVNAKIVYLGQGDSINAMKDGQIEAAVFFGGYPRPAYKELQASHAVNFIHLSDTDIDKVIKLNPYYTIGTIAKAAYEYLDDDAKTLRDRYAYVVHEGVDEDTVYQMVKVTLSHLEDFRQVHRAVGRVVAMDESLWRGVVIPMHPGAIRAYDEMGLKVPDRLRP